MTLLLVVFFIIVHKRPDNVLYLLIETVYLFNGRVTELYVEEPSSNSSNCAALCQTLTLDLSRGRKEKQSVSL